jgi:hypothetical protein
MTSWQTSYLLKMYPERSLELAAIELFASEHARNWWISIARESYKTVGTKRERMSFTVIDEAYLNVMHTFQAAKDCDASPGEEK